MNNSPLPPLPAWQARSFWLTLVGAAAQVAVLTNFDLFGFFGVGGQEQLVDAIMQIVAVVAMIWAWFERKAPSYKLSLTGKSETNP